MTFADEGQLRPVVVRVLRPAFVGQPHFRAQFLDPSNWALQLVHENLVLTREGRGVSFSGAQYLFRCPLRGTIARVFGSPTARGNTRRKLHLIRPIWPTGRTP